MPNPITKILDLFDYGDWGDDPFGTYAELDIPVEQRYGYFDFEDVHDESYDSERELRESFVKDLEDNGLIRKTDSNCPEDKDCRNCPIADDCIPF